jgi:polysaccharide export outer membrane protein
MKRMLFCLCVLGLFFASVAWSTDYIIGDGDSLSVAVWGVPELSVSIIVRPDGKITLPAAGDVVATGFTPSQLGQELTRILGDYVKAPIVTVTVVGITNNRIYISGSGVPSQVVLLTGRTTLFKLMCGVEGIVNADLQRASVVRNGEKLNVDVYDLFIDGNIKADIDLMPDDILFFPSNELNKVYVVGAVNTPQAIMYRDGLRILDVILESGGFTKFAKASAVSILRKKFDEQGNELSDDRVRIKLNLDDLMNDGELEHNISLQRGDYVLVKEGMF